MPHAIPPSPPQPRPAPGTECRPSDAGRHQVDTRRDARIAERAAPQWGVLGLDELLACGLTQRAVVTRVETGRLHRLHRTVYAVGHANVPLEGRFLAAVKACGPDAVLSHVSAAALHGFVAWDGRAPEVTVPGPGTRIVDGVRVHRSRVLPCADTAKLRGIAVTSPGRTLIDLAGARIDDRRLRRAVREAEAMGATDVRDLVRRVRAMGPRRGSRRLARILSHAVPTRSVLEDVVHELLLIGGLVPPEVNRTLWIGGRRVVPDFRWPAQHLVVEADGARWHDGALVRADDAERQALLEAAGERVVRVTWRQVVDQPARTLARIRAAGAPALRVST